MTEETKQTMPEQDMLKLFLDDISKLDDEKKKSAFDSMQKMMDGLFNIMKLHEPVRTTALDEVIKTMKLEPDDIQRLVECGDKMMALRNDIEMFKLCVNQKDYYGLDYAYHCYSRLKDAAHKYDALVVCCTKFEEHIMMQLKEFLQKNTQMSHDKLHVMLSGISTFEQYYQFMKTFCQKFDEGELDDTDFILVFCQFRDNLEYVLSIDQQEYETIIANLEQQHAENLNEKTKLLG